MSPKRKEALNPASVDSKVSSESSNDSTEAPLVVDKALIIVKNHALALLPWPKARLLHRDYDQLWKSSRLNQTVRLRSYPKSKSEEREPVLSSAADQGQGEEDAASSCSNDFGGEEIVLRFNDEFELEEGNESEEEDSVDESIAPYEQTRMPESLLESLSKIDRRTDVSALPAHLEDRFIALVEQGGFKKCVAISDRGVIPTHLISNGYLAHLKSLHIHARWVHVVEAASRMHGFAEVEHLELRVYDGAWNEEESGTIESIVEIIKSGSVFRNIKSLHINGVDESPAIIRVFHIFSSNIGIVRDFPSVIDLEIQVVDEEEMEKSMSDLTRFLRLFPNVQKLHFHFYYGMDDPDNIVSDALLSLKHVRSFECQNLCSFDFLTRIFQCGGWSEIEEIEFEVSLDEGYDEEGDRLLVEAFTTLLQVMAESSCSKTLRKLYVANDMYFESHMSSIVTRETFPALERWK